jgi:hypothetical protein
LSEFCHNYLVTIISHSPADRFHGLLHNSRHALSLLLDRVLLGISGAYLDVRSASVLRAPVLFMNADADQRQAQQTPS